MKIAVGQTWVRPDGATYTVRRRLKIGWEVTVNNHKNEIHASVSAFQYTDKKFAALIAESSLTLYDRTEDFDTISEKLDRRGHKALASALDDIGGDFGGEDTEVHIEDGVIELGEPDQGDMVALSDLVQDELSILAATIAKLRSDATS